MLLGGPALYALALIMAAALVVPAVFSVDTNVRDFSVESYKNMQLRQLYAQLESGAYAHDSDECLLLQRQADALSGYVYSETSAKGYASLAEYERLRPCGHSCSLCNRKRTHYPQRPCKDRGHKEPYLHHHRRNSLHGQQKAPYREHC